jgi:UDP-N-acetylmuramoyl-tripeptide--D-alanyl-D-alanine ligase
MLTLALDDIAAWTGGRLEGEARTVAGVSIDTRTLAPGALFVALPGDTHDGHAFVDAARERGAAAALVAHPVEVALPQVVVGDPLRALGEIARQVRRQSAARVIGITGSNGKTTVKTLVAAMLARRATVHVNAGNFNNEIGLPLTLLALPREARFAVLEMGAGKPGDIAWLARIAAPDIGLINNIGPAHLERLGTLAGVAETKGALIDALPADGIAVVNLDDAFADEFTRRAGERRIVGFGLDAAADVSARLAEGGPANRFTLVTPAGEIGIALALAGRHNLMNALAATATALAADAGLGLEDLRAVLEAPQTVPGRLQRRPHPRGAVVIDDSYNANPASFAAAIALLAAEPGETVVVMGDMAELGAEAERLHFDTGALAKWSGVARLYAVGEVSRAAVAAFGEGATLHAGQDALIEALARELRPGVTLLVKGSRSAHMDRVVAALFGESANGEGRHAA